MEDAIPKNGTKGRIYEATRKLFATHGYAGTSMRQIAIAVGIEVPSLYNHIASKQQLLVDLLDLGTAGVTQAVIRALEKSGEGAFERLWAATQAHVQFHCEHREQASLDSQVIFVDAESRARVATLKKAHEDIFKKILNDGMNAGVFRQLDVTMTCFAILGMGGSVIGWFRPGRLTAREVGEQFADLAVRSVLSTSENTNRYGSM